MKKSMTPVYCIHNAATPVCVDPCHQNNIPSEHTTGTSVLLEHSHTPCMLHAADSLWRLCACYEKTYYVIILYEYYR